MKRRLAITKIIFDYSDFDWSSGDGGRTKMAIEKRVPGDVAGHVFLRINSI